MIKLEGVSFKYKDVQALDDINMNIEKGEAIAVIGTNGSGKSTFLKLLNGIIFPDSGHYRFDGAEISSESLQDSVFLKGFHKRVGFVFQDSDNQLFCTNIWEEIAFAPIQMGMKEQEVEHRVTDCLRLLDIEHLRDRSPYGLSGGEKRKVAIACVLSHNPDVLILDEPMNGLDPKTKRFLRELLIKLNKSGKTIICATHDFEYFKDVFTRAIVFSGGHQIIRDDRYSKVVEDDEFLYLNNIK